jgi:hypothetical protein
LLAGLGVAAFAMAGCSGSGPGKPASDPAAQRAIRLAASTSRSVNTLVARLTEQTSGTSSGGLSGTIAVQLKPTTMIHATFEIPPTGTSASMKLAEILTDKAVYFKDPTFAKSTGKAWVKATISQLTKKTGISLASLLQNLEGSNPLDQTRFFTASTDVHVVGSRKVSGVATTEYAGTYSPAAALSQLPASLRKLLGPVLRAMGPKSVHFTVWIDAQHLIRKAVDTETAHGQAYTTTFVVTSVNKPVTVRLPKSSQVAALPRL